MDVESLTISREGTIVLPERMRKELCLSEVSEIVAIASIADGDSILLKPVRSPSSAYLQARSKTTANLREYSEEDANKIVSQAVREVRQETRQELA